MARKLYIHLGAHKSASSTIQNNLLTNSDLLKKRNIWYIPSSSIAKGALGFHFRDFSAGRLDNKDDFRASLDAAEAALAKLLEPTPEDAHVLLSWEGFLGHSALDTFGGLYTNIHQVANSLRRIFPANNTRYLMIIRRQDEFIESCYLQQIKERRAIAFPDFIGKIEPAELSWKAILDKLQHAGTAGGLSVVPFELIKHNGTATFVSHCLNTLLGKKGVCDNFQWKARSNASLSAIGVDIALQALPHLPTNEVKKQFLALLRGHMGSDKQPKAAYLDEFTRKLLVDHCRADNMAIFESYMNCGALQGGAEVEEFYLGPKPEVPRKMAIAR